MIKLDHVVLASPEQMDFIIEGMRNRMNSWEKKTQEKDANRVYAGKPASLALIGVVVIRNIYWVKMTTLSCSTYPMLVQIIENL